jgi:twinkle protein
MIERLEALGINLKGRTKGEVTTVCPECSHDRKKKDDKCLSVNVDKGVYCCHHCGWKGKTSDLISAKVEKDYVRPEFNNTMLSDKALAWFKTRGISKNTAMRYKLSSSTEYLPQVQKKRSCINFNYFRDEALVNVKFRDAEKNFKLVKDAELIFYGLDMIKGKKWCVITEGEMDALSLYESGVFHACSVPNGANVGRNNLSYLDNCVDAFKGMEKIYLALDKDTAGLSLQDQLTRRLGRSRCLIVEYPNGYKDANEVLMDFGIDTLKECFDNAKPLPVEGITFAKDQTINVLDLHRNGLPQGLKLGYDAKFDDLFSLHPSQFTLITGIPGHGKSNFLDQIMILSAKIGDWKFAVFSAEKQPVSMHIADLVQKLTGKGVYTKNPNYRISESELHSALDFIHKHFFFINMKGNNLSIEGLIEKATELAERKGIDGFVIDNWATMEHSRNGKRTGDYVGDSLTKINEFKQEYGVHVFLVAHPRKIETDKKTGKPRVPNLYDVADSAHFFNLVDTGLVVYRNYDTNIVDIITAKMRWQFVGQPGEASFSYNVMSGLYSEVLDPTNTEFPKEMQGFVGQPITDIKNVEAPF